MPDAGDRPEASPEEEAVPEVSVPVAEEEEPGLLADGVPPEEVSDVSAAEVPGDVTGRLDGLPGRLAEGVLPEEVSAVSAEEEPGDVTERPAGLPGLLGDPSLTVPAEASAVTVSEEEPGRLGGLPGLLPEEVSLEELVEVSVAEGAAEGPPGELPDISCLLTEGPSPVPVVPAVDGEPEEAEDGAEGVVLSLPEAGVDEYCPLPLAEDPAVEAEVPPEDGVVIVAPPGPDELPELEGDEPVTAGKLLPLNAVEDGGEEEGLLESGEGGEPSLLCAGGGGIKD